MINKTCLIRKTHERINKNKEGYLQRHTYNEVDMIIDTFLDVIKDCLIVGDDVKITGLCKFVNKITKERIGRNPQNSEEILLPSRRIIKCKVAESLNDAIKDEAK